MRKRELMLFWFWAVKNSINGKCGSRQVCSTRNPAIIHASPNRSNQASSSKNTRKIMKEQLLLTTGQSHAGARPAITIPRHCSNKQILTVCSSTSVQRSKTCRGYLLIGSPIMLENCIIPRSPLYESRDYAGTVRCFFPFLCHGTCFETHAWPLPTCFATKEGTTLFWRACVAVPLLVLFYVLHGTCETIHSPQS